MKKLYWLILMAVLAFAGCSEDYDDSDLRNDMQNLENRVNALERWQSEANSNINSLQSIVNSLNGLNHITSVTDLKDSAGNVIGCTLHFAQGDPKNVYYGSEGKEGKTPAIGVKLDSDGIYYWTVDGNYLLDKDGKKVPASGTPGKDGANGADGTNGTNGADGKDGITPKLKIENDYWYVSYDNGATWTQLEKTTAGTASACIFKGVTVSENYITFTLADGTSFALPYGDQLSISFGETESHIIAPYSTIDISYEVTSSTKNVEIEVIGSGDISAEVVADDDTNLKGKIRLTTGALTNLQSKVVVLVTNGSKVVMRSISFEKETMEIADNAERSLPTAGGEFTVEFLTNVEYDVIISDDAKSWISTGGRALTKETITFQAVANNGDGRVGTITIQSRISNQKLVYTIKQEGANSITFTDGNGVMPSAGTLTAEYISGDPDTGLSKMVDNDHSTCYEISGKKKQINIIWEAKEALSIGHYYLSFGYDTNKMPKGIVFYGSNDGNNWDYLIGIGGEPHLPTLDEEFPSKSRYKYIKLEVNNPDEKESIAISEFHLTAAEKMSFTTFDDVVAHGTSFTYTASTPMGNHYENKHVTTESDKVWLSTASNEPALLQSAPGYTWRTYEVDLYPFGEPVPADVNQHGIGDCSALAVFASMSYLFPDFIKSIIKDNNDGTYTVDMFDPQGEPVQVTVQSTFLGDNNGIGAASGKKGEATWASVLEKAIMKWNYIYQVNPDISGIGSEHVAPLFTGDGSSFAYYPNTLDPDQMKQVFELSIQEPMIVIGGFNTGGLLAGSAQTVTAHAYSFFYSNQTNALFAMRNPWGFSPGTSGTEDGVMNIMDDGIIPPTIDMRIIYPGKAADYVKDNLSPYIPPQW